MKSLRNPYIISIITKLNIVILTLINSIIINRYLGPTLMGEYSYIINYVNILSLILAFSITQALPFFMKKYGNLIERNFVNIIYIQTFLYFIITFVVYLLSFNKIIVTVMILSILTQFYQQISFVAIIKNLNQKNILTIVNAFIYTVFLLIVIFIENDNKLNIILFSYVIKLVIGIFLHVFKQKIFPRKRIIKIHLIREILVFSLYPAITSLLITLNYKLDIIILKRFENFSEIGLYSLGVTLAGMLWIIPDSFKDVLFNKTAKSDSIKDIIFSIKFNIYLSLFVILGFLLLGQQFIKIIYGIDFINSFYVTLLLLIGNIPMVFFKMINTLYISKGKQKMSMYVLILAVICNVIGNIILIPIYGIEGAAFASILSYSVTGFIFLLTFIKEFNIPFKEMILINKIELKKLNQIFRRKL